MKIYFDFDRTLFDTKTFLERIYSILKEYEIPLDLFDRIRLENKDDGFNLFGILEKVKEIHPFNTALYTDLERLIECDRMFLFADVEKVLEKLKKLNCKLYILTKGNERFQRAKIGNTNIANYFDDIIFTMKYKGELDIDYNAIFVDDSVEEIESILKNNPKKVIYINRYSKDKMNDKRVLSINSLEELYNIIK